MTVSLRFIARRSQRVVLRVGCRGSWPTAAMVALSSAIWYLLGSRPPALASLAIEATTTRVAGARLQRRKSRSERESFWSGGGRSGCLDQMFTSRFMPCPDCGASLDGDEIEGHGCELEHWLDYQMFQLRDEIDGFEADRGAYLASGPGLFEQWYARRRRE